MIGTTKFILITLSIAFITIIGSSNIIPLDKYVIDTGAYLLYDSAVIRDGPTYENDSYLDGIAYPDKNAPTITIGVQEFNNTADFQFESLDKNYIDSALFGDYLKVEKPYPGRILVSNGTVYYLGKIGPNAILIISTTDINSANYLIKNIQVYPKNQENALIASTVANGLK